MLELLKKIGIPATVAAIIATLVTTVPLLFKIDERYAKDDDLVAQTARTEKAINELTIEISKLSGTQETIVTIMAAQEARRAVRRDEVVAVQVAPAAGAPVIVGAAPVAAPKPVASSPVVKFDEVSRTLREQQSRLQTLKY
jgi:sugar phosphate isomerase/epimerase